LSVSRDDLLLYAVTDRHWLRCAPRQIVTIGAQIDEAIAGGVTMVQVREKGSSFDEFLTVTREVINAAKAHDVPVIVNDSLEVALASGADGLHVGQSDGDPSCFRKALGPEKILGVSIGTVSEAICAEAAGADYLGVGAVFPTDTKGDAVVVPVVVLAAICEAVSIPVVAIGGITARNAKSLAGCGIAGIAAVSALFGNPCAIRTNAEELREAALRVCKR
jgi:thiamine-phosphate pyrophosphorylase